MELSGSKISYILGNANPKNLLMFQEVTFQARQNEKKFTPIKFLMFQEAKTLKTSYISGINFSTSKIKKNYLFLYQEAKSSYNYNNSFIILALS